MTARVIAVAGVVAALVVAVFFPPRVIAGQNGSRVGITGYCAEQAGASSELFAPFDPFARYTTQPGGATAAMSRYKACVAQGVPDVPLLAVYLAGILGGTVVLTWTFSTRART